MNKKEALEILIHHTQYFVSNDDLHALNIAIESLAEDIKNEEKQQVK